VAKKTEIVGYIYILTNPAFPDYVKIGYADDVKKRVDTLNASDAVPFAFRIYGTYAVENRLEDRAVHDLLDKINPGLRSTDNINGKKRIREFYALSAEDAFSILSSIAAFSGHADRVKLHKLTASQLKDEEMAREIEEANKQRAENFRFSLCDIKKGEFIEWHTDESLKFEVASDRKVKYKGKEWSLTPLAKEITGKPWALAGPKYFKYKGEYLNDIRSSKGN